MYPFKVCLCVSSMDLLQGRTVDLKTLTLIEEPKEADIDNAEEEFEKLLRESGE